MRERDENYCGYQLKLMPKQTDGRTDGRTDRQTDKHAGNPSIGGSVAMEPAFQIDLCLCVFI